MDRVRSSDGTELAVETTGSGPPLVLAVGAFCDRATTRVLAERLADAFTVHAYDRRGRGDSAVPVVPPYERERELEDLRAVLTHAGATPALYGHSSGAVLAAEVAMAGAPVSALALYEPPWVVPGTRSRDPGVATTIVDLVAAGRHGDAVATFMIEATGASAGTVEHMRAMPFWGALEALAPTLPYDLAIVGEGAVPVDGLGALTVPTLVMDGGDSAPWARTAVAAAADAVPGGRRHTFAGQDHGIDQELLAPVLRDFLLGALPAR